MGLLEFYIAFSYLVLFGIKTKQNNLSNWNILIAPITLPIFIGQYLTFNK